MKTVKINQKSNFSILLFILIMVMLAVGSTAFGQKKSLPYKYSSEKKDGSTSFKFSEMKDVDSIVTYFDGGGDHLQVLESKSISGMIGYGEEVGGNHTWYYKVTMKNKDEFWFLLTDYKLTLVEKPNRI